ncbi:WG repeat-containing protein [Treponema parvum]|uniref:WG repeat-containing protein n=1 Tax=Treponema parvum TaxID=138851 RepID=UPI001AEBEE7B|nr:WG repeat-containing protein [Treponema parvum]QTQ15242.1 WG repeat-containing protein [Treponema parvum]
MKKIILLVFSFLFTVFCSCAAENLMLYPINKDGNVTFIDNNGKVITAKITGVSKYEAYEFPTTQMESDIFTYYDFSGAKLFLIDFQRKGQFEDHVFSNGLLDKKEEKNGLYGYIDISGNYVIPAQYELCLPFSGGVAWARYPAEDAYGLIDKSGNMFKHFDYHVVTKFVNGYSYVLKQVQPDFYIPYIENGIEIKGAQEWVSGALGGIVDKKGNVIISFTLGEYTIVSDDAIKCKEKYLSENGEEYSLYGYKNLNDQWIISPIYIYADNFKYGMAEVSKDNENFILINKKGGKIKRKTNKR